MCTHFLASTPRHLATHVPGAVTLVLRVAASPFDRLCAEVIGQQGAQLPPALLGGWEGRGPAPERSWAHSRQRRNAKAFWTLRASFLTTKEEKPLSSLGVGHKGT